MNGKVPAVALPEAPAPALDRSDEASGGSVFGYALLFVPYALAVTVAPSPSLSFLVAWAGSFWILFLTWSGRIKPLPPDRSLLDQVMRPVVLTQLLFVGYTCLSSIFFFLDVQGYYYFSRDPLSALPAEYIAITAEAQRLYVLAHAGVAAGMLALMDYRRSGEWAVRPFDNPSGFLLVVSVVAFIGAQGFGGSLGQIGVRLQGIGLVASVLALALSFPTRRLGAMTAAAVVYAANLGAAFLSGWKEEVLVMVILLAVFAYPYARRTVLLGAPIALVFLLAILPTYANVFRSLNWEGTATEEEAAAVAYETIRGGGTDIAANNWGFLRGRLSEIGLFVEYIESVETTGRRYGTEIVEQAAVSMVPRAFWKDKPITERLVMQRVYENGVVSEGSSVSAKPQYVVDGYLSAGAWGVLLAGLAFGLLAALASRAAERWFGGYLWGTGLVYTALFAILWKGSSFEFFFNAVVWSFVLMVPLFWVGRLTGVIVRHEDLEPVEQEARPEGRRPFRSSARGLWAAG